MTLEIWLVLAVLAGTIFLFVVEWVRVDVVGLGMMAILPLLGLVTPEQALSGLSSNAVVAIIAVIILGAGLDKAGIMDRVAETILRFAGSGERSVTSLVSGTAGVLSGFLQNIGAAALFLPATRRIARRTGASVQRILLPMGYCAIIGGCLTLVGSSPLIMLNDLMAQGGGDAEPFGLFSVTPVGLALLALGVLYFLFLGRFLLPADRESHAEGDSAGDALERTYGVGGLYELHVPDDNRPARILDELRLRREHGVTMVAVAPGGDDGHTVAPDRDQAIRPGDDLAVVGRKKHVRSLADALGWELRPELRAFGEELAASNAGMREGIVVPHSELARRTMGVCRFRERYGVTPLAVFRNQEVIVGGLSERHLRPGDALLLHGTWDRLRMLREKSVLVFSQDIPGEPRRTGKAGWALFWLAAALALVGFQVALPVALLAGALGMILTGVLTIDEAYTAVDWMTVFLLAGLIPLGLAFEKTGAARLIAQTLMGAMDGVPPLALLGVVGALTSFFTLVASNVGAAVLLVPLAMNMAAAGGADPRVAALVVAVAASNTFILPTHQVNALIMRPGGYHTRDYARAGALLTVLYLVVMLGTVALVFGVSAKGG